MRTTVALLAFLGVLLAGCNGDGARSGEPADEDECTLEPVLCDPQHYLANHHCIANDIHPRVYAPDTPGPDSQADPWELGDAWTYRVDADGRTFTSELAYYEDIDFAGGQAQHYLVGSKARDEAFDHALFSINPMLGRIHRTLYSPHESGAHADMFNFPLCEGATWITIFYDTTFQLTARRETVTLPDGTQDPLGFRITGTSGDGSTLTHTYSPAAKWFTELDLQRADGLRLTMDLQSIGSGKTGQYHFMRAQRDEILDVAQIDREHTVVRENGGEGAYDLLGVWLDVQRTQGNGRVEVHLRDPTGVSRACVGHAGSFGAPTLCPQGPLKAEVPFQAGEWTVTVEKALVGGPEVAGEVRIVSIYDRSGQV